MPEDTTYTTVWHVFFVDPVNHSALFWSKPEAQAFAAAHDPVLNFEEARLYNFKRVAEINQDI